MSSNLLLIKDRKFPPLANISVDSRSLLEHIQESSPHVYWFLVLTGMIWTNQWSRRDHIIGNLTSCAL
jgi:hypothetical protein